MMTTPLNRKRSAPLMLPGQAAAPEGPIDMTFMYVMHHGFRRDLAAFVAAAKATPVEDQDTWAALARRWDLFGYVLHKHHSVEDDAIWPFLRERADAAGRATLQAMEDEHAVIDPLLDSCAEGLAMLAQRPDDEMRAALVGRLTAARESLGRHLDHEETDAIALIQSLMTAAEWQVLEEEQTKKDRRIRDVLMILPWAAHGLPADVRERAFANAGRAFSLLWLLTRGPFERKESKAFRHASA